MEPNETHMMGEVYQGKVFYNGQVESTLFGYVAQGKVSIMSFEKDTIAEVAEVLARSHFDMAWIDNLPSAQILRIPCAGLNIPGAKIHLRQGLDASQLEEFAIEYSKHVV